ncbi:uncharacterized protein LOC124115562 isoform X2 [Haliotis rufescens]|uniref:uncharacterized protein LOC124115562 isoform X2 n=1 Tax=Haliotis rufescens TaxID=6454 RepID=UPI001EB05E4B|nr:uncharacterized protein LOC124115562 isoform X2 [Haliotis rufescens]
MWIAHPTFSPRSWSVFNIAVRTNNFVEGWHRRINNKVGEQSLGIYRLVQELFREASLLPLQSRLIRRDDPGRMCANLPHLVKRRFLTYGDDTKMETSP